MPDFDSFAESPLGESFLESIMHARRMQTVVVYEKTIYWARELDYSKNFSAARTALNADTVTEKATNDWAIEALSIAYNYAALGRQGLKLNTTDEVTILKVKYEGEIWSGSSSRDFHIVRTTSMPTTWADVLAGSLLTTITVNGTISGEYTLFSSGGDGNPYYVWAVAKDDWNNSGYPSGTQQGYEFKLTYFNVDGTDY